MLNDEHLKFIVNKCKNVYKYQLESLKNNDWLCTDISKAGYLTGIIFWLSEWIDLWDIHKIETKFLKLEDAYRKQEDRYLCWMTEWLVMIFRLMKHDEKVYNLMSMLAWTLTFKKTNVQ